MAPDALRQRVRRDRDRRIGSDGRACARASPRCDGDPGVVLRQGHAAVRRGDRDRRVLQLRARRRRVARGPARADLRVPAPRGCADLRCRDPGAGCSGARAFLEPGHGLGGALRSVGGRRGADASDHFVPAHGRRLPAETTRPTPSGFGRRTRSCGYSTTPGSTLVGSTLTARRRSRPGTRGSWPREAARR